MLNLLCILGINPTWPQYMIFSFYIAGFDLLVFAEDLIICSVLRVFGIALLPFCCLFFTLFIVHFPWCQGFLCVVLGLEPGTLYMPGKPVTEPHP